MTYQLDRRRFLQNASVIVLSATSIAGTVSHPPASPAAPRFNGGRSQVNLNFLQTGGDYPFLNCLKTAQAWALIDNSGSPEPSTLDSDGYPISISHGGVYTVFFVPSQAARPGNYVITWSGNGTIYCGMSNTAISGSKTSTNGNGRYVFSTTDTRFVVGIRDIGNPRITNLQVFHADDEVALISGQVFGTKFKQRLSEANFGVIRFLNWQNGNTTNVTTWATRKPTTYAFYGGSEFRNSLYAGVTDNIGVAYKANLPNFNLLDKATIIVKFNVSNNTSCTLNVSGTGDIRILSEYAAALSSDGNSYPTAGRFATLVYDATLNAWIKQGGDVAALSVGLDNGCPPELMVRLCAEVGAHPYFVAPPLACDPMTDYMPSLASYVKAFGPSWMIPRFEGPNELWNSAAGFYQTGYANAKAIAYGWGPDFHNWYGKVMSVLGQAVSAVYGADRSRYQILCGIQTATGASAGSSNARLASTKYISQTVAPQSPYTRSPASNWVTHVCCAQYFSPSERGAAQEMSDAAAYVVAAGNTNLQLSIATNYANTVNSGAGTGTLSNVAANYASWKAWALGFGIKKMCGYEGGYSPAYAKSGVGNVDTLRSASKQVSQQFDFLISNYSNFVKLSIGDFIAEFPSCFQLSGPIPSDNAWSVLEDIYQSPNPPQWNAIVAFNH